VQVAAAETLTEAIAQLIDSPSKASLPFRCSEGLRKKNCTIDSDCDTRLGFGDGRCDVPTGVAFSPPLTPDVDPPLPTEVNQVAGCTPGRLVSVPAGTKLSLRAYARRTQTQHGDKDSIRLICEP
jgi:hypothetical protein